MIDQAMTTRRRIRWSDDDRHLGPLTWAYGDAYKHWAAVLSSRGDEHDGDGYCTFRLNLWKLTLILPLPGIVRPWREKVYPSSWDAETVKRLGRNWYWNVDQRRYGFSLNEGFLTVYYGREGGSCADSSIQQQWSYFLPWKQWRQIAHRLYHADGSLAGEVASKGFDALREVQDALSRGQFAIIDYDDERIEVQTYVEEREWRLGTGWFRWLGYLAPKKRRRSLDISFKDEVGPEKGSWKGGVMGTGIEMLPGETQEQAMRRYCEEDHRSKYRRYKVRFAA